MRERNTEFNKAVMESDSVSESHSFQENHFQPVMNPEPPEEASYDEYGETVDGDTVPSRSCSERSVEDTPSDQSDGGGEPPDDSYRRYNTASSMGDGGSSAVASGASSVTMTASVAANALVAVAAVAVVAVAVIVPLLGAPSAIVMEECIITDSSIYYQLFFEDYEEGMELTVDLHNNFTHRTHTITSERFSITEYDLKPDMGYTLTVYGAMSAVREEFSLRTLDAYDEPTLTMNYLRFNGEDFGIDCSFTISDDQGEWRDFRVQLSESNADAVDLGTYDIDDVDSSHTFPLPSLNDGRSHIVRASVLCDLYGETVELYSGMVSVGYDSSVSVANVAFGTDAITFDLNVDDPYGAYSNMVVVASILNASSGESQQITQTVAGSGFVSLSRTDSFTFADVELTVLCDILGEQTVAFEGSYYNYDAPAIGNVVAYGQSAGPGANYRVYDVSFDIADPLDAWGGREIRAGFTYPDGAETVWGDTTFTTADRSITFTVPRAGNPSNIVFALVGATLEEVYNESVTLIEPTVTMDSLVFDPEGFAIDFKVTVSDPRSEWSGSRMVFTDSDGEVIPEGEMDIVSGTTQTLSVASFRDGYAHTITAEVYCVKSDSDILMHIDTIIVGYDSTFTVNNLEYGPSVTFDAVIDDPYGARSDYVATLTVRNASDTTQSYSVSTSISGSGAFAIERTDEYAFADMELAITCKVLESTVDLYDSSGSDYTAPAIGNVVAYGQSAGPGANYRVYDVSFDIADPLDAWGGREIRAGFTYPDDAETVWGDTTFTTADRSITFTVPRAGNPSNIVFALVGATLEEVYNEPVSVIEPTVSVDSLAFDSADYSIDFKVTVSDPRSEWSGSRMVFRDIGGSEVASAAITSGTIQSVSVSSLRDGEVHTLAAYVVCDRGETEVVMHNETITVGYDAGITVTDISYGDSVVTFDVSIDDPHGAYSGMAAVVEVTDASTGYSHTDQTAIAENGSYSIALTESHAFMDFELSILCDVLSIQTILFQDAHSDYTSPVIGNVSVYGHPVGIGANNRTFDVTFDLVDADGAWDGETISVGFEYISPTGTETVWGGTITNVDRDTTFTIANAGAPANVVFGIVATSVEVLHREPATFTEAAVSVDSLAFDSSDYSIDFTVTVSDPEGEFTSSKIFFSEVGDTFTPIGEIEIASGMRQSLSVESLRDGQIHTLTVEVICIVGEARMLMHSEYLTVGYNASVSASDIVFDGDSVNITVALDDPHGAMSNITAHLTVYDPQDADAYYALDGVVTGSGVMSFTRTDGYAFVDVGLMIDYTIGDTTGSTVTYTASDYTAPEVRIKQITRSSDVEAPTTGSYAYTVDYECIDPDDELGLMTIRLVFDSEDPEAVGSYVESGRFTNAENSIAISTRSPTDPVEIRFYRTLNNQQVVFFTEPVTEPIERV